MRQGHLQRGCAHVQATGLQHYKDEYGVPRLVAFLLVTEMHVLSSVVDRELRIHLVASSPRFGCSS